VNVNTTLKGLGLGLTPQSLNPASLNCVRGLANKYWDCVDEAGAAGTLALAGGREDLHDAMLSAWEAVARVRFILRYLLYIYIYIYIYTL